ncbi:hypothetical protein CB0940_10483 [Cercospora beticola]|uniref:Uncharacterized protein n=1 Tax=Cercospora beticola TaxID=122368 RepID=A0A2G5HVF1_CERBT|nr:hypothetical protein CB0940_10483 [Cercospora beticola]PIA96222.1 hypothetical protein CB0940_10483 [Cercospora beticola]WPB07200.1 hypothetical protein RHO25_011861 [Cercospora beticola]CAK1367166.1 unnamed protein product [Cercospora beticola]
MSRPLLPSLPPPPPPFQRRTNGFHNTTTGSKLLPATSHTRESRVHGQEIGNATTDAFASWPSPPTKDERRTHSRPAPTQSRLLQIVKRRRRTAEVMYVAHRVHKDKATIAALLAREGVALARRESRVRTRENALAQRENELLIAEDVLKQKCTGSVLVEGQASLRLNTAQETVIEHYRSRITSLETQLKAANGVEAAVRLEFAERIGRLQGRLDGRSEQVEDAKGRCRDTQNELVHAQLLNRELQEKLDAATRSNNELQRQRDNAYRMEKENQRNPNPIRRFTLEPDAYPSTIGPRTYEATSLDVSDQRTTANAADASLSRRGSSLFHR